MRHSQDESLHPQSRFCDVAQISRGKFDRLRRTTAGFTTSELDGYGLRNQLPARPPPSDWVQDFHLQAAVHARHTMKKPPPMRGETNEVLSLAARQAAGLAFVR